MSNPLLDLLRLPLTGEELLDRLKENGYYWSQAQLDLYVELDKDVSVIDGKYTHTSLNRELILIREIENIIGSEEITTIPLIISNLPGSIVTSKEEVATVIKKSKHLELLSNNITVKRINQDT